MSLLEGLVAEAVLCVAGGGQLEGLIGQLQCRPWMLLGLQNFLCFVCCGEWQAGMSPMMAWPHIYAGRHARCRQVISACGLAEGIVGACLPWAGSLLDAQGCPISLL